MHFLALPAALGGSHHINELNCGSVAAKTSGQLNVKIVNPKSLYYSFDVTAAKVAEMLCFPLPRIRTGLLPTHAVHLSAMGEYMKT